MTNRIAAVTVIVHAFLLLSQYCGSVNGAAGLFVFGDSYTDTGETNAYPYGITWPGPGQQGRRSSDGRNEVDFLADLFGVPSPTPWEDLAGNGYQTNGGTNFGVGGAGVTYAYGFRPLSQQIDQFQGLVNENTWPANQLSNSVAVISMGVNDYTWYNQFGNGPQGIQAFVTTVVDTMAAQIQRIQSLGVPHIVVDNVVPMGCMPYSTLYVNGETACVGNYTLDTETNLHDSMLQSQVQSLNSNGGNVIMVDLTKALRELFQNGQTYGFSLPYQRCCTGDCGKTSVQYSVCSDPSQHVIFDSIHPTQAAWKAIINLYAYSAGYTKGPTLAQWIQQYQI